MESIRDRVLSDNIVTLDVKMDEFSWSVFAPKVGDVFYVEEGMFVIVVEATHYGESQLGIIRIKKI